MYELSSSQANKFKYLKDILQGDIDAKKRCPYCGHYSVRDNSMYEGLVFEASSNKIFPDKIMYGGNPGLVIISHKALEAFEKEKISGYTPFPIAVCQKGKQLDVQYYILKVEGRVEFNYKKMGRKPQFYCEKCGYIKIDRLNFEKTIVKDWDGSDLFLGGLISAGCTDRVLDVIRKYKLTGFDAIDIIHAHNPLVDISEYIRLNEHIRPLINDF